jgi:hypothetical protein
MQRKQSPLQIARGTGAKLLLSIAAVFLTAPATPAQAVLPTLTADQIVQRLLEKNKDRADCLQHYAGTRSYRLEYRGFPASTDATMEVAVNFDAPGYKRFTVLSMTGSKMIENRVFNRLLESEEQAVGNRVHSELGPANYSFSLAGIDGANYVLNVEPKTDSRFLYRGKIWVDGQDFAVTRIEAQPAKSPSFWTTKSLIHHTYEKLDNGIYLPKENKTVTNVRMGGVATLTIEYGSYQITAAKPVTTARRVNTSLHPSAGLGAVWPDGGFNEEVANFVASRK